MHITIAKPSQPPQIKIAPVSAALIGQISGMVAQPEQPFAFVGSGPLGLGVKFFNTAKIPTVGAVAVPTPEVKLQQALSDSLKQFEHYCLAEKLLKGSTPFTAMSLGLIGAGKSIEKLRDPNASTFKSISYGTGFAKNMAGALQATDFGTWLTPYNATFKIADTLANTASFVEDFQDPNGKLPKLIVAGIKCAIGCVGVAAPYIPYVAPAAPWIDRAGIVVKIGEEYFVAILENLLQSEPSPPPKQEP
jgi:hypothetical protein